MGDSEIESNKEELTSYTESFEKNCAYFMAIGLSYTQYWYEDCWIANAYLEAYNIKKEQLNEQYWLQGMYIYEALCDVSPVLHAFSKKGTKPIPYSKEPYPLFKKKEEKEFSEEENQTERDKAEIYFRQWARKVAKNKKGG